MTLAVPSHVLDAHEGWSWQLHYQMLEHRAVYRLLNPDGPDRFLKVAERNRRGRPLSGEAMRLLWAAKHTEVPEVIDAGLDDDVEWLLLGALDGVDATDASLLADPAAVVADLAEALRAWHQHMPVDECPFHVSTNELLVRARLRVEADQVDPAEFHPEHRMLSPRGALNRLERSLPEEDDIVVCHGDYCFPNVLFTAGKPSAFLDLGELGVGDRWYDLAIATWSTQWNVGADWEAAFLDAYGIEPDPERIAWYRLAYDLL